MEVMKTQASFGAETKFASVSLHHFLIEKRAENSITLTFDLNRRIDDDQIEDERNQNPAGLPIMSSSKRNPTWIRRCGNGSVKHTNCTGDEH